MRYVYFDWPGPKGECHHHEIRPFSGLVGDELRFSACSYHTFFGHLKAVGRPEDEAYLAYLAERYFLALQASAVDIPLANPECNHSQDYQDICHAREFKKLLHSTAPS